MHGAIPHVAIRNLRRLARNPEQARERDVLGLEWS
jgi:hypothetical protein